MPFQILSFSHLFDSFHRLISLAFLICILNFLHEINFILLYFTDLQHEKMCPGKISASGAFFFNFDEYLMLQKSVACDEWEGNIN